MHEPDGVGHGRVAQHERRPDDEPERGAAAGPAAGPEKDEHGEQAAAQGNEDLDVREAAQRAGRQSRGGAGSVPDGQVFLRRLPQLNIGAGDTGGGAAEEIKDHKKISVNWSLASC